MSYSPTNDDELARRVTSLHEKVNQFKTSQPIGAACSRVFDLQKTVSFPMDYPQHTAVLAPTVGGLFTYLNPTLISGDFAPTQIRVTGNIEGVDIVQLRETNDPLLYEDHKGFDIGYSAPSQWQDTSSVEDFPLTCFMTSCCGVETRYIKVGINGNTVNNYNHWVEIEAYSGQGEYIKRGVAFNTNLARGKTVTAQNCSSTTNIGRVTDGDTNTNNYYDGGANGYSTVTVDLGGPHYIWKVVAFFYYGDNRTYKQVTISHGLNNVSGTANLANVIFTQDDMWSYYGEIGAWAYPMPTANLTFTVRTLCDGFLDVYKTDTIV